MKGAVGGRGTMLVIFMFVALSQNALNYRLKLLYKKLTTIGIFLKVALNKVKQWNVGC